MWVHSNPLMSHAGVTFISPPVVTPPPVAKSVSFTGYITMLWVRPLEMCLDPYKIWIQVDPIFEFLKLLLCCDVALSSPIVTCRVVMDTGTLYTVMYIIRSISKSNFRFDYSNGKKKIREKIRMKKRFSM